MHGTGPLDQMSEDDVLAFAQQRADMIRAAEADLLRAAYQWAVLHDPARLDPDTTNRPGRERARRPGGPGTPEVTEFAAAVFGARIGRSPHAAAQLIADALDLHHRLPRLWARVETGEVKASYARHVAKMTRDLTPPQAAHVDAGVAEPADGRISWSRFETLVEAKIGQADPQTAREKEEHAARATFAKKLRTDTHGMATFMVRADLPTIDAIDAAVTATAATLTESMPDADADHRRVHAVLLLTHPGATPQTPLRDLLPTVQLYLHSYTGPDAAGPDTEHGQIARLEGHGPVTEAWITRVLGPRAKVKITPVLDLAGQAPVDAYEIPTRHRQAVHLITPADTFPFASSLSRDKQVDHTIPFDQGGASGIGNYGPMTIRHHRIKTHGRWQVQQPFPGIYVWRDPHGTYYLVDHTGTRRLPTAA